MIAVKYLAINAATMWQILAFLTLSSVSTTVATSQNGDDLKCQNPYTKSFLTNPKNMPFASCPYFCPMKNEQTIVCNGLNNACYCASTFQNNEVNRSYFCDENSFESTEYVKVIMELWLNNGARSTTPSDLDYLLPQLMYYARLTNEEYDLATMLKTFRVIRARCDENKLLTVWIAYNAKEKLPHGKIVRGSEYVTYDFKNMFQYTETTVVKIENVKKDDLPPVIISLPKQIVTTPVSIKKINESVFNQNTYVFLTIGCVAITIIAVIVKCRKGYALVKATPV